jgi:hypothetical protein
VLKVAATCVLSAMVLILLWHFRPGLGIPEYVILSVIGILLFGRPLAQLGQTLGGWIASRRQ